MKRERLIPACFLKISNSALSRGPLFDCLAKKRDVGFCHLIQGERSFLLKSVDSMGLKT